MKTTIKDPEKKKATAPKGEKAKSTEPEHATSAKDAKKVKVTKS